MARLLLFLKKITCFSLLCSTLFLTAQIDSLEQKLSTANKEEKIKLYVELTNAYEKVKIDKAIEYAKLGLELTKTDNSKHRGFFYLRLGNLYNDKTEHVQAMYYHKKALEVSEELNFDVGKAKCYQNIGVTHVKMGEFSKALNYYLKALKIYEEYNEENLVVVLVGNIGSLYSCRLEDDENGSLFYNRALDLSKKTGNEYFRSHILGAVSEMYMRQKKYAKAKESLKESIEISERVDLPEILSTGLTNLSNISIEENNLDDALRYSNRALQLCIALGISEDVVSNHLLLATVYEKKEDIKKAESHYSEALSTALKIEALPQLSKVYEALYQYNARKKDYKKSNTYILKYHEVQDSLFSIEKDRQIKEVHAKYDLESKDKEIQLLTNVNKISALENENQRTVQIILITALVALLMILSSLIYAYKNKQISNKKLEEKNGVISQALKDREVLMKEVHHRVKNNLQIVASLFRLQHKFGNNKSSSEILQEVQDKIQAMSFIHERLYKSNDLSMINLQTYLDSLLNYFGTSYNLSEQNIEISTEIDNIKLGMDRMVPCGLIVNEIIANSIKYAFGGKTRGEISIKASKEEDQCVLTIQDSGVGFPENFNVENSQSLGIQLIQGLTRQIKGTLEIMSNPGACYTITFNLAK